MQLRMQEAEKRMIQDDILTDDVLMEPSGEFPRPSGMVPFPPPDRYSSKMAVYLKATINCKGFSDLAGTRISCSSL